MGLEEGSGFSWAGPQGAGPCDGPCPWHPLHRQMPELNSRAARGCRLSLVPSNVWNFLCHLVGVLSLHFLPETQVWLLHFEDKREGRAGVPPSSPSRCPLI